MIKIVVLVDEKLFYELQFNDLSKNLNFDN